MTRLLRVTAIISIFFLLYGCELALVGVGAGIGVGTYRYAEGDLERNYPLSFKSAWNATNTALSNRHISVSKSVNEVFRGRIEAVRKDGKRVIINLKDKGQNVTEITVRVGFMGSRNDAEILHDEIRKVARL